MTPQEIESLGPELATFLDGFADCFGRSETRGKLATYVRGQLSDRDRKSAEPIALDAGISPRSLQEFLGSDQWDNEAARDRIAGMIVRDHFDPEAIGVIDESGHPKKGSHTACVQRQYCGATGKIDNCVVSVHLVYAAYNQPFRAMLDTTLFLPEHSWTDAERRRKASIPEEVVYRPKHVIALEQIDRAVANGVAFSWLTADEWYTQRPTFLQGLEDRGLRYVMEMPRNFRGYSFWPGPEPASVGKPVENLCRYSQYVRDVPWVRYHIKDTGNGPMVWDAKAMPIWLRRAGQTLGPYWLVWTRNALDPTEEKYFLSNAAPGTPIETILHVAFRRWPVERCLQDAKSKLGMSHFEVRKYLAIQRHLLITQLSHFFLARQTDRLRGGKSRGHDLSGSRRRRRHDRRVAAPAA
jgi:SRSO17 transposase